MVNFPLGKHALNQRANQRLATWHFGDFRFNGRFGQHRSLLEVSVEEILPTKLGIRPPKQPQKLVSGFSEHGLQSCAALAYVHTFSPLKLLGRYKFTPV
jgi:hypothetical protein